MAEVNSCYKWCSIFMSMIGLWPYCNKKFRHLHNYVISFIIWASVICQVVAILAIDRDLFRQLRDIPITAMAIAALTKYHVTWYQINYVKAHLDQIRLDWETNNVEVLRIMQIYAFYGKRLVLFFATFFYPGLCIILLYHISPIILDIIIPLNESRPIKFSADFEFWIEKEQHPIFNISLFWLVGIVDVAVLVGTESFTIMICLHMAGLFDVASYYFEKAVLLESVPSYRPRNSKNEESISYIVTGVLFHRRVLRDLRDFTERSKASYSFLTILGIISASISLFCLSVTVLQLSDIRETIFFAFVLIATFGYMFWLNLAFQYIIDSADSVPLKTYNTNWYGTSIATQKLLQLIILKSNESVSLNFFSILTPSIECFAMFVKASVSYFTVLLSLQ